MWRWFSRNASRPLGPAGHQGRLDGGRGLSVVGADLTVAYTPRPPPLRIRRHALEKT